MSNQVVTFGEIMMRLSTPGHTRYVQAPHLEITFGGGEANVATSLALCGIDAAFVSRLPNNAWGERTVMSLRGFGVDTSKIVRADGRMGVYFVESGAGPRASQVIYDRADSAITQIKPGEIDWAKVFDGVVWFHWTGITPALGAACVAETRTACEAAKAAGCTVSVDLNYRKKLWTTAEAQAAMTELMPFVDVCIANEEDAESVFSIKGADVETGEIDRDRYIDVARQLTEKFGFKQVAITLRESISASRNGWSAMLFDGGEAVFSRRYDIDIVDRVGGGDSFAAGLIYSQLHGMAPRDAINWAVAASALKHTLPGDANLVGVDEIKRLAAGDASGR
ncbi:MAG: sugar kinase, partial [Planctomycetota bacterium]